MAGWYDKPEVRQECLKIGKREAELLRKVLTYNNGIGRGTPTEGISPLKSAKMAEPRISSSAVMTVTTISPKN
jgi:hypothetical protein